MTMPTGGASEKDYHVYARVPDQPGQYSFRAKGHTKDEVRQAAEDRGHDVIKIVKSTYRGAVFPSTTRSG